MMCAPADVDGQLPLIDRGRVVYAESDCGARHSITGAGKSPVSARRGGRPDLHPGDPALDRGARGDPAGRAKARRRPSGRSGPQTHR